MWSLDKNLKDLQKIVIFTTNHSLAIAIVEYTMVYWSQTWLHCIQAGSFFWKRCHYLHCCPPFSSTFLILRVKNWFAKLTYMPSKNHVMARRGGGRRFYYISLGIFWAEGEYLMKYSWLSLSRSPSISKFSLSRTKVWVPFCRL